jgi:hypothetical protein
MIAEMCELFFSSLLLVALAKASMELLLCSGSRFSTQNCILKQKIAF